MVQKNTMSHDVNVLENYFAKLGLEPEIAGLYLALNAYGPQTISELARNSGVERTRIYRLLETLPDTNLIEVKTEYKRSMLKAAPISNLQILLSKKEEDLRELKSEFQLLQETVLHHSQANHVTQVEFYKGIEGLKQMFWNQTRANTDNLSILYENMQNRTNSTFFERWVRMCNERNIQNKGIISDHFLKTQKEWYAKKDNERLTYWESRYVPDTIFPITHSTIIYNDIVAYYNWREDNIFGIEVVNQEIADAQRAFFAMLWEKGKPLNNKISQQLP